MSASTIRVTCRNNGSFGYEGVEGQGLSAFIDTAPTRTPEASFTSSRPRSRSLSCSPAPQPKRAPHRHRTGSSLLSDQPLLPLHPPHPHVDTPVARPRLVRPRLTKLRHVDATVTSAVGACARRRNGPCGEKSEAGSLK